MRATLQPADFAGTVVAVPPLALTPRLDVDAGANAALIRHIEQGGVRILLYGGNANLYHVDLGRLRALLHLAAETAGPDTVILPSIGPDLGRLLDAVPLLRDAGYRHAMALPAGFPSDEGGIERGLRLAADRAGFGLVLYVKRERYLAPASIEHLVRDGVVTFVKYAVERADPASDPYLDDLLAAVGHTHVASGMGETPLHDHMRRGLVTWTSGGVCIAPRAATALLAAYRSGNQPDIDRLRAPFLAFEQVRTRLGGIAVLHDAVTLSGIADMGPILPMLSNLPQHRQAITEVTVGLQQAEEGQGPCPWTPLRASP